MHDDQHDAGSLSKLGQSLWRSLGRRNSPNPATLDPHAAFPLRPDKTRRRQSTPEMQGEELRRTQIALEVARTRYFDLLEYTSTLYNQAPVGYLTLTPEGTIVEANLTATKLLAITREFLLRQSITHFIVAEDREFFHAYSRQLMATQRAQRCEVRMLRADGVFFYAQLDANVIQDPLGDRGGHDLHEHRHALAGRQRIRLTISDISSRVHLEEEERKVRQQLEATLEDLRRTQAQMVKQERLAVVGQLAAGIAHDFNNILAVITLYAQLLSRASDLPAHLRPRMEAIGVQTERATHLVQQILDFSRRAVLARQATGLTLYLQQLVELLQRTLPETIRINLAVEPLQIGVEDVVDMDPSRIQQVLLNLAVNARDAMPSGGELQITLARLITDSSHPPLASGTLPPGTWLRIAIIDTGTGIDPQHLPHLFEPFFTTREVGSGSGLGLAQVLGIVKQHGGEVDVTSRVGEGTTFAIYLPALAGARPAPAAPESEAIPLGQGELVLVVEDMGVLRTALVSTLEQLGYQVLNAKDGQAAAALMAQRGDEIKAVLSDLIMPHVTGEDLIRTLRAQGRQQPVVVLSGHPLPEEKVDELMRYGQVSWLPKPPTLAHLATTLHQALHPPTQGA